MKPIIWTGRILYNQIYGYIVGLFEILTKINQACLNITKKKFFMVSSVNWSLQQCAAVLTDHHILKEFLPFYWNNLGVVTALTATAAAHRFMLEFELPLVLQRSKLLVTENVAFQEECSCSCVAVAVEASFPGGIQTLEWSHFLTAPAQLCNLGFALYSTDAGNRVTSVQQPNAEEKLFTSASHCSSEKGML